MEMLPLTHGQIMVKKSGSKASEPAVASKDVAEKRDEETVFGLSNKAIETLLFAFTVGIYVNSLWGALVYDDAPAIVNNLVGIVVCSPYACIQ
jgi:hypothetical protein